MATAEMVICVPVLIVLMLFIVGVGRLQAARQKVEDAAADAARVASLQRNPSMSAGDASSTARSDLAGAGITCQGFRAKTNLKNYRPGGWISVEVWCTASLSDVAMAGFPGEKTFHDRSVVPIETHRAQ